MSAALELLAVIVPAYLLGALPWGLWIARMRGVDIRRVGSGNLGATNVYRQLGPALGLLVLVLDMGKGALAVGIAMLVAGAVGFPGGVEVGAIVAGLTAIFGHVFTVFAGFKGGKGVATTIGVFLVLTPIAMVAGLVAWLVVTYLSKRVSAGSLALAIVYPIVIAFSERGPQKETLLILATIIAVLIVVRHIGNIRRLLAGTEPPFSLRPRASNVGGNESPSRKEVSS